MQEEANKKHGKLETFFYVKQENEENRGRKC